MDIFPLCDFEIQSEILMNLGIVTTLDEAYEFICVWQTLEDLKRSRDNHENEKQIINKRNANVNSMDNYLKEIDQSYDVYYTKLQSVKDHVTECIRGFNEYDVNKDGVRFLCKLAGNLNIFPLMAQ